MQAVIQALNCDAYNNLDINTRTVTFTTTNVTNPGTQLPARSTDLKMPALQLTFTISAVCSRSSQPPLKPFCAIFL